MFLDLAMAAFATASTAGLALTAHSLRQLRRELHSIVQNGAQVQRSGAERRLSAAHWRSDPS